ncbi:MAG: exodeoxyribonuclease VII small subunit [Paludibacteraceae bacterium]|nr:exodeoxyribonuclease VII small subunit [Paludibacteraceae bacterium]
MAKAMTYKAAMQELESILDSLKDGSLSMDDICASVQRATELVKFCKEKIYTTEQLVQDNLKKLEDTIKDDDNE